MADSPRVAYEKELAQKLLQKRLERAKEGGYKTKEELREERVAQQKTNTGKLLTPGTSIKGLVGTNTAPFDATSTTLNGMPALSAKGSFIEQSNQFGKPGYLPKSIQYAGSTLYGLQKGDTIFYPAKNETPLMKSFKTKIETPDPDSGPDPDSNPDQSTNLNDASIPSTGPRLDPNATERYASNFKAGQANMSDIQEMYADRKDLQEWAKANPALAQKEFAKAEAKAIKSGKASSAYDSVETFKPSDIPEADRQNPIEQASALGGNLTKDAQVFKDNAMASLVENYGNKNIKPIVEGITLPTTTDYAGAFNQADIPDLQSVMNMGDKLEKFGYGDLDINPQKFMSAFRGNVTDTSKSQETSGLGKTVDLSKVNNLLATLGEDEYFKRLDAGLLTGN